MELPRHGVDFFLRLEKAVWRALCEGDAQADGALLADDFLGVYPTGFADKPAHVAQLRDGPTISTFSLSDARVVVLARDVVLLAYKAQFVRQGKSGRRKTESMWVSSIWREAAGTWRNVFSQDTESP